MPQLIGFKENSIFKKNSVTKMIKMTHLKRVDLSIDTESPSKHDLIPSNIIIIKLYYVHK